MKQKYNKMPLKVVETPKGSISIFSTEGKNIDAEVVQTFGEEWIKFEDHSDDEIRSAGAMYFDILDENILNKNTYALDIGCGTGRWTKCLAPALGFIEAIDPSDAVFAAANLLNGIDNVRLTKASIESIPFEDETFDFIMSIGVLHHIPDTQKGIVDCVKKLKQGGYFYCYLYYNLETQNVLYRFIFRISDLVRKVVSKMPSKLKRLTCDVLAVLLYMPFVFFGRLLNTIGMSKLAKRIPLADYIDKTFFVIRNDSLDRFGTTLEQRFSKQEVIELLEKGGLSHIVISPSSPYYHAVGRKG